jgi:hypothetical protein
MSTQNPEAVEVPEEIRDLICSLNIYDAEYVHDTENRVLSIAGKPYYMNRFNEKLYFSIRYKDLAVEYAEYGGGAVILVLVDNKETGTQILLNQIKLKNKPHIWFKSGYLNIKY